MTRRRSSAGGSDDPAGATRPALPCHVPYNPTTKSYMHTTQIQRPPRFEARDRVADWSHGSRHELVGGRCWQLQRRRRRRRFSGSGAILLAPPLPLPPQRRLSPASAHVVSDPLHSLSAPRRRDGVRYVVLIVGEGELGCAALTGRRCSHALRSGAEPPRAAAPARDGGGAPRQWGGVYKSPRLRAPPEGTTVGRRAAGAPEAEQRARL